MRNTLKNIGLSLVLGLLFASCDSTSDPITPAIVPSTFEFLFVKSPGAFTGNASQWNLKKEVTAGATFTGASTERSDDFATLSTMIPSTTLMSKQCSAYDKSSKRYVVSSGERVIVYNFNTVSGSPIVEFQHSISNIQAMEFANGRFFFIKNNILMEGDIALGTPITSFTSMSLAAGQVSNLTQKGNYLSVVSGGSLYIIDVSGSGSLVSGYPQSLGTTDTYEGLETINSPGAPFKLFVVKRNATTNEFQEIALNSSLAYSSINTKYTLPISIDATTKISTALDYTTEFYYIVSADNATGTTNRLTVIDLSPTVSSTYMPTTGITNSNYAFGLQLKD